MRSEEHYLEQNISRLVKLAGRDQTLSSSLVDTVIDRALVQLRLRQSVHSVLRNRDFASFNWDKAMGWAAVIAVVYAAGFELLLGGLSWINPSVGMMVAAGMFVNWLTYFGRLVV